MFLDVDGDGVADPGEGITGVRVIITADVNGNGTTQTFTATTDANGHYLFSNLPAGTFRVTVNTATLPVNVTQTFDLDGTSTANAANATLITGQSRNDVNFGYRGAANLGNRVWLDQNRNGQQDLGEGGVPPLRGRWERRVTRGS